MTNNIVDLKTGNSTELNTLNYNPFEEYGNQVSQRPIVGRLLKFSKGDYLAGEDGEEIPAGTQLVACMDQLMIGWIKWVDNKPEQQIMGSLVEGYAPPRRKDLGDDNEDEWEVDSQGKPRDPWQFTNYIIMKEVGKVASDDVLYTFSTSSRGGISAVGDLCKAFGKEMRTRPDEWPIVSLEVDSYVHPNKEYGRIKFPILKIVGWEPKSTWTEEPKKAVPSRRKK